MSAILLAMRLFFGGIFSATNLRKWFGFIVTHWRQILICTFVCMYLYIAFSPVQFLFGLPTVPAQKAKVVNLEHNISLIQAQLKTCENANNGLSQALDDQNKRIKDWADLSSKIDASSAQLAQQIAKSRVQSQTNVQHILNAPTPKTCQEAMTFMSDAIRNGNLVWKKGP